LSKNKNKGGKRKGKERRERSALQKKKQTVTSG